MQLGDGPDDGPTVKLYHNKKDAETYENFADLFAILKTTEKLERAYVRDAVTPKEYEPACQKLIAQYKTLWDSLRDTVPDVQQFMATYSMQCPMATKRLIHSGMPATVEHGKPRSSEGPNAMFIVAETVQHFITTMDSVKLNMLAVDQLSPLLNDLMHSINQVNGLPPDFVGKEKVKFWVSKLHPLPANYELTEDESRQLLYDLESSHSRFMSFCQENRR